jgi:hypothetical protein
MQLFLEPFLMLKMYHFTKTGAGQTCLGKTPKKRLHCFILVDGVELVCDSDLCIVPITSATLPVKALAAAMGRRGWSLFATADPQPRGSIEVCVGTQHVALVDQWCEDLAAAVLEVQQAPPEDETKKKKKKPEQKTRGVSAYDAVSGDEQQKGKTAAAGEPEEAAAAALQAKLRGRLLAYVESSLEVPKL